MIACNRCGKENQPHYKFCLGCGAELGGGRPAQDDVAMMNTVMADPAAQAAASPPVDLAPAPPQPLSCSSCGTEIPPNFKFCGACGTPVVSPAPARPPVADAQSATMPGPIGNLILIRPDGTEGGTHDLIRGENRLGREFGEVFATDGYLSPVHAELVIAEGGALIRDLDSLNGVFLKMTAEEEVQPGQVVRVGQELLRFEDLEPPAPTEDGTEIMGSPNPGYWGKLTVIIGKDVDGAAYPLLGESVTIGRERGDINFPEDGYVSGLHARLSVRDGSAFLADLGSSNGTFVRIDGERQVTNGDCMLLGQQLFRLNLG